MMAFMTVTIPFTMAMKQAVMAETSELNCGCGQRWTWNRARRELERTQEATAPIVAAVADVFGVVVFGSGDSAFDAGWRCWGVDAAPSVVVVVVWERKEAAAAGEEQGI